MKLALFAVLLAFAPAPAAECFEEDALVECSRASKPAVRVPARVSPLERPVTAPPRPLRKSDDPPTIASTVEIVPRVGSRPPPAR
jgi:hypothetical protein